MQQQTDSLGDIHSQAGAAVTSFLRLGINQKKKKKNHFPLVQQAYCSSHSKNHYFLIRGKSQKETLLLPFSGQICFNKWLHKTLQSAVFQQKNIFLVSVPRVRLVLPPSQDIWWEKFPLSRPLQSINKSTHYELMGKQEVASQREATRADI